MQNKKICHDTPPEGTNFSLINTEEAQNFHLKLRIIWFNRQFTALEYLLPASAQRAQCR